MSPELTETHKEPQEIASQILVPLPSFPEQQRIAAILTEQLAAVERARQASEARLEAARALPAAYLRGAFESEESSGWPEYALGELALIVQNGIYKEAEFYGLGEPFLRMYNVDNSSWRLNQKDLAKVLLNEAEKERFQLAAGDLLISRVNSHELVGKCGIVDAAEEGYVFENMLIRVRLAEEVEPMFMAQQFATRRIREALRSVAKRAIGQSSINSADLKKLKLRLPARERQAQLAAELDARLDSILEFTSLVDQEFAAIGATPPALLRQAFSGAL